MGLLALMGTAFYENVRDSRESAVWVEHTHAVLETATAARAAAVRLESYQRALLAVGQLPQLRADRAAALDELRGETARLLELTKDNPDQQERVRTLSSQLDRWTENAQRAAGGDAVASEARVEQPESISMLVTVGRLLAAIDGDERGLLVSRRQREAESEQRTIGLVALVFLVSITLLAWAWWDSRRRAIGHARAESRFRDLVQALPVSLWLLRVDQRKKLHFEFVSDNAFAVRHVMPSLARENYDNVLRSVHDEDRQLLTDTLKQSLDSESEFHVDYRVVTSEGTTRWIHSSAKPRRELDGSLLLSGYWADVTEERELRNALAAATDAATTANRAKSAFLAAMSHEIRTPMNGVLGLLELLSLTRLDSDQKSTLAVVRASGESLLRIVDDILDFSKMEAERLILHCAPASVSRVLNGACQIHASHASGKGLLLRATVDPAIKPVLAFDEQRVGQILNNLIGNALKFTERGSVTVGVSLLSRTRTRDKLAFVVTDTGIGITEQDLERLFEPFVQSAPETASRFGGTGLGLVISRRLAELMGGTLEMRSIPGEGTTVTVTCEFDIVDGLELVADPHARVQSRLQALVDHSRAPPSVREAHEEGTLVLLADDHPTNRMVLKRQVNSLGYAAETVADGLLAYEAWKTGRFSLVIADCNMPEMTGHELTRAIRLSEQERGLARTPILACTANAMVGEKIACLEAGMDDYLTKPTRLQDLATSLQRWLPLPMKPASVRLPVDLEQLKSISGGNKETELEILVEYRLTHDQDAARLRDAVTREDVEEVARLTHRIRGACLALGSGPLAEAASLIQEAARRGPIRLQGAMGAFESEFQVLMDGLASMTEHLQDGATLDGIAEAPKPSITRGGLDAV
jgi:signal transduction histidine kinase/CheY-like chemotaxis protein/HPt (histidine-containing phosphotransfer) domain-containing protein/CHASE3 domain sensor protein